MSPKVAKWLSVVLIAAFLLFVAWVLYTIFIWGPAQGDKMPLTLSIGSGPITLVQNSTITTRPITTANPVVTLPVASTAGDLLVVVLAQGANQTTSITSGPAGFLRAASVQQLGGDNTSLEIWYYPNNPGGILAATFVGDPSLYVWSSQISEWSGVGAVSPLETSGTATATGGTTLTPTTSAVLTSTPKLVIAAWMQRLGGNAAVTFSRPPGYTLLKDEGSVSQISHLDIEYSTTPAAGLVAAPVLTSTGSTFGASGAVVVFKAGTPATDMTAFLAY